MPALSAPRRLTPPTRTRATAGGRRAPGVAVAWALASCAHPEAVRRAGPTEPTTAPAVAVDPPDSVAPSDTARSVRQIATELCDELMRRYRAHDMEGVAAMYADDAVLLGPRGYRVQGREAIDAYWGRITDPIDWTLETLTVEGGDGLIHQRGVSTLRYRRADGGSHTSIVQFALVWIQRDDGSHRIAVDAYWR